MKVPVCRRSEALVPLLKSCVTFRFTPPLQLLAGWPAFVYKRAHFMLQYFVNPFEQDCVAQAAERSYATWSAPAMLYTIRMPFFPPFELSSNTVGNQNEIRHKFDPLPHC